MGLGRTVWRLVETFEHSGEHFKNVTPDLDPLEADFIKTSSERLNSHLRPLNLADVLWIRFTRANSSDRAIWRVEYQRTGGPEETLFLEPGEDYEFLRNELESRLEPSAADETGTTSDQ